MYGGYIQDPTAAGKLGSPAWSARRDCFVLKPANPYKFLYKRARYCEQDVAGFEEYHAIFGDGDDVLPLIFIHRSSNRTPCIASTTDERWRKKAVCRSPYKFFTGAPDEAAVPWESFQYESSSTYIPIPEPDLELHQRAEDTGDGAESDPEPENAEESWWGPWKGWSGDWTRKFIERDRQRMPLESLDKIIWGYHDKTKTCTWGVKLRLIPQQGKVASKTWYYDNDDGSQNDEGDDDEDEDEEGYTKERLVSYIVLATVLEVYVKSDLLTLDVL
ncbi:hypothetical protein PsYK624_001570 [Phanerochaete sordida]|uniref:Uncharacterized protein n=1 Tax=Phanerochaete sordida TaxID=48140 RepID=A0A9P3FVX9_9APHY|nr:hypothetical protein PsYK624_001570 [Phanerochaete sordida]